MNQLLKKLISFNRKIKSNSKNKPHIVIGKYDIKYYINPESALDDHIVQNGIFGDWIAKNRLDIPENGVVLDIGANNGSLTSIFAKRYVPKGMVYAYEPDPQIIRQLHKNIKINKFNNVLVRPIALQDKKNVNNITFHIRRAMDGDGKENRGLSSIVDIPIHEKLKKNVSASTIDKEVARLKIKRLDFIKIDVEGAEFKVLKGGARTITRFHPILQYEYSNVIDHMVGSRNASDSFNFLNNLGYRQLMIINETQLKHLSKPNKRMKDVNVLCFWEDVHLV